MRCTSGQKQHQYIKTYKHQGLNKEKGHPLLAEQLWSFLDSCQTTEPSCLQSNIAPFVMKKRLQLCEQRWRRKSTLLSAQKRAAELQCYAILAYKCCVLGNSTVLDPLQTCNSNVLVFNSVISILPLFLLFICYTISCSVLHLFFCLIIFLP